MAKRARVKMKPTGKARVTSRHEAQAQFHRNKQLHHRRQMRRRAAIVASAIAIVGLGIFSWRLEHSDVLKQWTEAFSNKTWKITSQAGFSVKQIYLTGRVHADPSVVKAALNVQPGDPILALHLAEMKTKLESIPEVKSATVSRQLPGDVSIVLIERTPVAIWQHGDAHLLVDIDGIVLAKGNYPGSNHLPVIVGEDAPKHVRELTTLLASVPELQQDVVAAVRIGDRRWNLQLKHDMTVMLPESAPEAAWQRFAKLAENNGLLNKAIRSVDMRMEDRVFIMPLEQQKSLITLTNARET